MIAITKISEQRTTQAKYRPSSTQQASPYQSINHGPKAAAYRRPEGRSSSASTQKLRLASLQLRHVPRERQCCTKHRSIRSKLPHQPLCFCLALGCSLDGSCIARQKVRRSVGQIANVPHRLQLHFSQARGASSYCHRKCPWKTIADMLLTFH